MGSVDCEQQTEMAHTYIYVERERTCRIDSGFSTNELSFGCQHQAAAAVPTVPAATDAIDLLIKVMAEAADAGNVYLGDNAPLLGGCSWNLKSVG